MVADYDSGRIDALICWDLDRLTLQPRQLEDWIDRAEHGQLLLVTANGEADLSTNAGRLFARIKAAVARSEVERNGARQSRAQRQRAAQGRWCSGGVRPLGYTSSGDVIPAETAEVLGIYRAIERGNSMRDIARALSGSTEPALPDIPTTPRHMHTVVTERNARRAERGLDPKPVPRALLQSMNSASPSTRPQARTASAAVGLHEPAQYRAQSRLRWLLDVQES